MNKSQKLFLYTLFFLSGVCGLVYEVVWSRQFLLIFGNTTYSVVGVITSFILGLGIGNYLLGRYADKRKKLVSLYALLEVLVGVFAITTLYSIPIISAFFTYLVQSYSLTPGSLIILKFLLSSAVLFPATICMGGTLPILIRYFSKESPHISATVGSLYFINTLGAFCGALASGFFLIELFGLKGSIIFTAVVNICIGYLAYKYQMDKDISFIGNKKRIVSSISPYKKLILLTFLISGMTSFVYQVLWVRILTPSTGTYIFAFSIILAIFLLGIALGSYMYEKYYSQNRENLFLLGALQIFITLFTASSVFVNTIPLGFDTLYKLCLTIIPATICMGMTFPVVSSLIAHKDNVGEAVGTSYLYNTIGNVLGAYVSAFILLPFVGTAKGILLCSVINFCIGIIIIIKARTTNLKTYPLFAGIAITSVCLIIVILNQPYQVFLPSTLKSLYERSLSIGGYTHKYYEDNVSSVFAYTNIENSDQNLIIDGVPTTYFGTETSILSHLPLFVHPNPDDVLVIALGMGRTFKSALLHDVSSVDVVELVPSVLTMLPLFHADDSGFLSDRRGTVIINDGRNFLETSIKKYDVIIVDAPPPVNAAGTTVLYSKEFYEAGKERMNPNGIFTVWFYSETKVDDFKMILRSFYEEFPHILVIRAKSDLGYYIMGSTNELSWDEELLRKQFEREEILSDINKNQKEEDIITSKDIIENFVGEEDILEKFTEGALPVTDDYPRTEYFLVRYITNPSDNMNNEYLK